MKKHLIDSDVLIDFFKKNQDAVTLIEHLSELGDIVISIISIAELRSGWNKKDASFYLPKLYDIFILLPVTKEIAEKAGEYREVYKTKGLSLPTMDTLIAATTKLYNCSLVTRNIKHYPMRDIDIYNEIYTSK